MKHLFLSLATITSLLLLILFSTSANGDNSNFVYDTMGEPVIRGRNYYIVPYNNAPVGGGFTWKKYEFSEICGIYYLIQYNATTNFGESTVLYPLHSRRKEITFSTNLNMAFNASDDSKNASHCHATSNVWKVEDNKVELDGQMGVIDPSNKFTIDLLKEGGYCIRFCPKPKHRRYACGGLGIVIQNGERQLVVNGTSPLAIAFEPGPIFRN